MENNKEAVKVLRGFLICSDELIKVDKFSKEGYQQMKETLNKACLALEENFKLEIIPQDEVKAHIKLCEGKHRQQVAYSSYHDALTQICFDCKRIRTNGDFK